MTELTFPRIQNQQYTDDSILSTISLDNHIDEQWGGNTSKIHQYNTIKILIDENQYGDEYYFLYQHEQEDPLTQVKFLDQEVKGIQGLIFLIRISLSITHRESIADRLLTLINDLKEESQNSQSIALDSLNNFYDFLQLHPNLKIPIITLTPDNYIYASWKEKENRLFSVHFLPGEETRFVMFSPNERHPERPTRISGSTTTDILIETLESSGIIDWIAE